MAERWTYLIIRISQAVSCISNTTVPFSYIYISIKFYFKKIPRSYQQYSWGSADRVQYKVLWHIFFIGFYVANLEKKENSLTVFKTIRRVSLARGPLQSNHQTGDGWKVASGKMEITVRVVSCLALDLTLTMSRAEVLNSGGSQNFGTDRNAFWILAQSWLYPALSHRKCNAVFGHRNNTEWVC